ncbi:MAG: OmpA family protein, partial [Nannocystaceae bacterium]|nr:OmpA family protein [Nannocystaceae bacterium]
GDAPAGETPAAEAPAPDPADPGPAVDGGLEADAGISADADFDIAPLDRDSDGDGGDDDGDKDRRRRRRDRDDDGDTAPTDDDPGMVQGRREHMMQTNRGGIGLFHTSFPDAGGRNTFRFRLHTDFFRKEGFMFVGAAGPDQHSRVRGGVDIGFSPLEYLELFFSVNSQANRNAREQRGRQDAETVFALGDVDFGAKGAYRIKKYGIGFGGQVGLGLLSGSSRLLTQGVNFWVDGMFSVDIRYLTAKQFPFRFTTNVGWMLDNSLQIAEFGRIRDATSREVLRFSLGANHNRMRLRNAIDFPIRFGKERQYGIDPFVEWSWDVSTQEEANAFSQPATPSPMPRSSQWITLGARANVVSGLHIDAGVDIGVVSPSFEFGPQTPPWQMILGLGWSFDPNPLVKEVEVEIAPPPAPPSPVAIEGRIVGQVLDTQGAPVPSAIVSFPGLTSTAVVTDVNGSFTSFRFPAGTVAVSVSVNGELASESSAEVRDGEDTSLTIQLEQEAAAATGIIQGAFVDAAGSPVVGSMRLVGNGVDQSFDSTPGGLIALELAEGDYRGTVTAAGYKPAETSFTVLPGAEVNVTVTLQPDAPADTPHVKASKRAIRLTQKIKYTNANAIADRSKPLLDELAAFLKQHSEYELVEVRTHTDDKGAAKKRTDQRAEAVKNHLVGAGVSAARLSTRGLGSSKPVAVNMTASGRAQNNRTEFSVKKFGG